MSIVNTCWVDRVSTLCFFPPELCLFSFHSVYFKFETALNFFKEISYKDYVLINDSLPPGKE